MRYAEGIQGRGEKDRRWWEMCTMPKAHKREESRRYLLYARRLKVYLAPSISKKSGVLPLLREVLEVMEVIRRGGMCGTVLPEAIDMEARFSKQSRCN